MASGDRRVGSSVRRGMTVLGKIPAVPKPINLPSQRLENRGLDPSVEIVPRGTFGWGSGRSPPTTSSSWGSVGLSSSPPVSSGAWSTAAVNSPAPSSSNSSGIENQSRPMSAGNSRPSSAGASRPSSASTTIGRAWGGALKPDEQSQPSRFNLTNADFPSLGSEKELNWRPLQSTVSSNRPTSADATKERHVTYAKQYESAPVDRPTSADATKERKPVYPGAPHSDRPISADGNLSDKGRQQPALRLPSRSSFADGAVSDQRHLFYTGVSGHGTAGPGPGIFDGPRESVTCYPVPVQQIITAPGKEYMFPVGLQHDVHIDRPGGPHGNNRFVLPVDAGPEGYGGYAFNSRPSHSGISINHHPQATWGPNYFEKAGNVQGQFVQPGPSERFHVLQPLSGQIETAVVNDPAVVNRRDGSSIGEEQRAGWAGPNVVYISPPVNAREAVIPLPPGNQTFPRPEMFVSPWGPQPLAAGWSNVYGGGLTVGTYQEVPSSMIRQRTPHIKAMGSAVEVVTENVKGNEKQATSSDEGARLSALRGPQAAASGNETHEGKDVQCLRDKERGKTSTAIMSITGPDILRNVNNVPAIKGALPETRPIKNMQKDNEANSGQTKESMQTSSMSQSQELNTKEHSQGFHRDQFTSEDNNNVSRGEIKGILKKKNPSLQNSLKRIEETDLLMRDKEEAISLLNAPERNSVSCSALSRGDLLTSAGGEIKNGLKDGCSLVASKTSENTPLKSSTKEHTISSASNLVVSEEEEKIPLDNSLKTKKSSHSVRRAHGRSIHEPHSVDGHVNHAMVWTPKPATGGITRDEIQQLSGDACGLHESLSTDGGKKAEIQPSQEHEVQGEIQVQQMQSAAHTHHGQPREGHELSIGSNKRPSQQVQHHRAEHSYKKQGQKVQHQQMRQTLSEQSMQEKQVIPLMYKDESSRIKYQQSVPSSHTETESPHIKKHGSVYSQKTPKNHHRQHEQECEATNNQHGQCFYFKEEKSAGEDEETSACEAAIVSVIELKKSRNDIESHNSRNSKQRKDLIEFGASRALEGHLLSGARYQGETGGKAHGPFLPVEIKVKDNDERTHKPKLLRQHEMQVKQSAIGSHQEHRYDGECLKPDTLSCESSTTKTEKRYMPKLTTKHYLHQELEAPGSHGPANQQQIMQEGPPSTNKVNIDNRGAQTLGTHTNAKKRDMLRYTPLPARKKSLEEQQCMTGSQPGQKNADLNEGQALGAFSSPADSELACATESAGKADVSQSCATEYSDKDRMQESFKPVQSKKEAKHYAAKSGGKQQQSPPNLKEEAPTKEETLQSLHSVSASNFAKRREGVKPYGAKREHFKQEESLVGSDRRTVKETGMLQMPEQNDLVGKEKQEKAEVSDHFDKDQNRLTKPVKSKALYRPSKKSSPPSEHMNNPLPVAEENICVSRVEEPIHSTKDHKQEENSGPCQKIGSRLGSNEVRENQSPDGVDTAKPKQNQRRRYQYQPVAQHLQTGKPQLDASNIHSPCNRSIEQGHNRYERGGGPRRGRGQAYYYRVTEHTDSNNLW